MKRTMVVFTSLFFNKFGNQSFFETIKNYSNFFERIVIITSYNDDSYFFYENEITEPFLDKITIYRTYNYIKYIYLIFKSHFTKNKKNDDKIYDKRELKNANYDLLSIFYYHLTNTIKSLIFLMLHITGKIRGIDLICSYEIGGVSSGLFASHLLSRKIKLVAKMQGTVLYPILEKHEEKRIENYLDHHAYKKLPKYDYITMTNDGTKGDKVLKLYGVPDSKIIFITNGLSESIINKKLEISNTYQSNSNNKIKLMNLSRLIPWKRVDLSIEIANILTNEFGFQDYEIDIYGAGSDFEYRKLNERIGECHLENNVYVCGPVPFASVSDIILDHDFLISLYLFTNIANPLLEAAYLGIGIISITSDDLLEILDSTKDNIALFKETTESDLCRQIAIYIREMNFEKMRRYKTASIIEKTCSHKLFSWNERCQKEISIIFNQ